MIILYDIGDNAIEKICNELTVCKTLFGMVTWII